MPESGENVSFLPLKEVSVGLRHSRMRLYLICQVSQSKVLLAWGLGSRIVIYLGEALGVVGKKRMQRLVLAGNFICPEPPNSSSLIDC